MNFDPITYSIKKMDELQARIRQLEMGNIQSKETLSSHHRRIDSLETWRRSWMRVISKWPLIIAPIILIVLNIAPVETVKAVLGVLAAL